ncbi:MAG: folylpolyglutamate synthase/dihydrofolate synthase family protein [Candidatus Micrarchaeota archaeon]
MAESEIRQWIESLQEYGINPGLERTAQALKLINNPQNDFESVLVSGTNGKGSTCAYLSHMLSANGCKTGFYSSPHLLDITERFRINQKPVSNLIFEKTAGELRTIFQENQIILTHFEFLTVLALRLFSRQKIQWAVLEIGMGGRQDAVNVVNSQAAAITNIALDHQKWLGNTRREIAIEKAGIIKKQKPFLTSESDPALVKMFSELAEGELAPIFIENRDYCVTPKKIELQNTEFDFKGFGLNLAGLKTGLTGQHQVHNAGLALAVLAVLHEKNNVRLNEEKTRKAVEKTAWPGRFQIISEKPLVIVDCCHNPAGVNQLAETLKTVFPGTKFRVLMGIGLDRNPGQMVEPIGPLASEMIFSQASFHGFSAVELQKASQPFIPTFKTKTVATLKDAAALVLENPKPNEPILVCGSIYLAGEAMQTPAFKKIIKGSKQK